MTEHNADDLTWDPSTLGKPFGMWIYDDTPQPWWKRMLVRLHLRKSSVVFVDLTKDIAPGAQPMTISWDPHGTFTFDEVDKHD